MQEVKIRMDLGWLYVFLIVSLWTILNTWAIYFFKKRIIDENNPLTLPFVSFIWSVAVIVAVSIWSSVSGSEYNSTGLGKKYFQFGWQSFYFFNIPIDSWLKYSVIVSYQVTRAILGSLLSNLFKPYLVSTVQNRILNKTIDSNLSLKIVLAQASVTVFGYTSTLTDLFLFLSQIDLSIISLFITLIVDAGSTYSIMQNSRGQSSEQIVKNILELESSDTDSLLLRKRGDKKSSMWRSL